MKTMTHGNPDLVSSNNGNQNDMARGQLTKIDMMSRVLKIKYKLYSDEYSKYTDKEKELAHRQLNSVLDFLAEFRY